MKKCYLIIVFFLSFSGYSFAQNVNIPDVNFKACLVGDAFINTNRDTEIQVSEAAAFTSTIEVNFLNFSDLLSIQAFTKITRLDCS